MKFFLDTANTEDIKHFAELGLVDGVTTNPTLVSREGRDFETVIKEITQIVSGPVSAEVTATKAEEMIAQARNEVKWASNIVVKIPMTEEGLKAVKVLSEEGIKTNVTLVFSVSQGLLAAKAGATYISPFLGRLDDIGGSGIQLVKDLRQVLDTYGFKTEIIAASVRGPQHVQEAALAGADIATIPATVFGKLWPHPLTDKGLASFASDWKAFQAAQK
ncbi:fructose-6-phosphate aldolase [Lactiplantibacillus plantarum]|uniref:Probable transaldolase n=1 Tax=Lactiplantibacillus plantarum TaxID=1590 RepID=A0AAX1K822_LACPN|nr:fructose-6-phosphate aldolase [Lactiplantibacillus plantarum]ETF13522.1 transaldolase [Lactiplantibacillus plantarum 4_3]KZU24762.1 Transaldolase [Lactiplantibacillus plantarum]KZU25192.1 Transaldolase [Lactiplantibacillus plantarum]MCG0685178.1 putative translaldolase [Lactiplantibacillus plantarum]MCW6145453.1 fructose-6-phosphate aldolase [Lactiplantibacillus plantarum]